jgi:hypothetical protein
MEIGGRPAQVCVSVRMKARFNLTFRQTSYSFANAVRLYCVHTYEGWDREFGSFEGNRAEGFESKSLFVMWVHR